MLPAYWNVSLKTRETKKNKVDNGLGFITKEFRKWCLNHRQGYLASHLDVANRQCLWRLAKSGEIDIMEHVGYDQNNVHFSTHSEAYYFLINTQKTSTKIIPTASTEFHKYRVDWTPYAIRGYFDDVKVFEFVNEGTGYKAWPFDKRFHILLNLAVGGNWGGAKGIDDSIFPQQFEVDYVRYYKMIDK